jgi:hypothetical protein
MNILFDFKNDTIEIFGRKVAQDTFRNFLRNNYPLLVKKFITKSVVSAHVTTKIEGNRKTIIKGGERMFVIDWEYVYALSVRTGYIMTDFIMYLKQTNQWNSGT